MKAKNKGEWLYRAIGMAIGLICALVLAAVFYGAMAYQLAGEQPQAAQAAAAAGEDALLALADAQLVSESSALEEMGGMMCTVTTRIYRTEGGLEIEAVSASPAAYIERLAKEAWTPQLITGFVLAGMDAVYSVRGEEGLLSCRDGERIYMLRAGTDEQTLYSLGAGAFLE